MGKAVRCDAPYPRAVDRPAARRSAGWLSRKGDRLSQGNGGSRTLWRALLEVWRKDSADSLRGQRNELLCSMPNWWKSSCGSRFVSPFAIGLAAHPRGTRGSQAPLEVKTLPVKGLRAAYHFRHGQLFRRLTEPKTGLLLYFRGPIQNDRQRRRTRLIHSCVD